MRRSTERWLVVGLLFVTAAYALAEDLTVTTYYPSPRGVYQELRLITPPTATAIDISATSSNNGDARSIVFRDPTPGSGPMGIEYMERSGPPISPVLSFMGPTDAGLPAAQAGVVAFMAGADTAVPGNPTLSVGIGTQTPAAALDVQPKVNTVIPLQLKTNKPATDSNDIALRITSTASLDGHREQIWFEDPTPGTMPMSIDYWDRTLPTIGPVLAFVGPYDMPGGAGQEGTIAILAPPDNAATPGIPTIALGVGTASPQRVSPDGVNSGNADVNDVYLRSVGRWASQGAGFGAWTTLAMNTTYTAATDGFVVYHNTPGGDRDCYISGQTPVGTERVWKHPNNDGFQASYMMPVRKGDTWEANNASGCGGGDVYWLPVGN